MKQFKTILAFELKYYFKNKIFVGITLFLVALIAVLMFFPRAKELLGKDTEDAKSVSPTGILIPLKNRSLPAMQNARLSWRARLPMFITSTTFPCTMGTPLSQMRC